MPVNRSMADLTEFPSPSCVQQLVSSFPKEWQGLFAALNVRESQAVVLGTKWLQEKAFSMQKGHTSPHWSSLVRALTLPFPVIYNADVIFRPKFSCLTLQLQRNLLSFIVLHIENIPQDDLVLFLTALLNRTQSVQNNPWLKGLTHVLQAKINGSGFKTEQGFRGMTSSEECTSSDEKCQKLSQNRMTNVMEIPDLGISKTSIPKLNSICSSLRNVLYPGSNLLASNIQLASSENVDVIESQLDKQIQPITAGKMDVDVIVPEPVVMDNKKVSISAAEVIEIMEDPLEIQSDFQLPVPPELPEISEPIGQTIGMDEDLSEIDNIPDKVIQFKENFKSIEEFDGKYFLEFCTFFQEFTSKELKKICQLMEMDKVTETTTIALIKQFLLLNKECSFQSLVVFAEYCIGSKLKTLDHAVSRNLLAAVVAFAKTHPKAFVDGVILILFELDCVQWPQCDLILKVVKGALEKEHLKYFLGKVISSGKLTSIWNDHIISIFAVLVDMKLELNREIFDKYVCYLQAHSLVLASNLKFAKLVLTTINKYGPMVKESHSTFQQILEENNTFLKKSALAALKKL